ncbi:MAG: hypothetical protein JW841_10715 [Deltaproteobacteria bacterium]|nr:hypothetical protein [Deltaproteobacteria bacterium]
MMLSVETSKLIAEKINELQVSKALGIILQSKYWRDLPSNTNIEFQICNNAECGKALANILNVPYVLMIWVAPQLLENLKSPIETDSAIGIEMKLFAAKPESTPRHSINWIKVVDEESIKTSIQQQFNSIIDQLKNPNTPAQPRLAVGNKHVCMIRNDHTLWCVGDNSHGQIAVASNFLITLAQISPRQDWQAVVAGANHTCGLTNAGTLFCFGTVKVGEHILRFGFKTKGLQIGAAGSWQRVAAGGGQTFIIHKNGTLWAITDGLRLVQKGKADAWELVTISNDIVCKSPECDQVIGQPGYFYKAGSDSVCAANHAGNWVCFIVTQEPNEQQANSYCQYDCVQDIAATTAMFSTMKIKWHGNLIAGCERSIENNFIKVSSVENY